MYSNSLLLLISSGIENHHHPDRRIRSHSSVMQPHSRGLHMTAQFCAVISNQSISGFVNFWPKDDVILNDGRGGIKLCRPNHCMAPPISGTHRNLGERIVLSVASIFGFRTIQFLARAENSAGLTVDLPNFKGISLVQPNFRPY